MSEIENAGTFALGDRTVSRMGYGTMQLTAHHAFGPPRDHVEAIAVLREAVEAGVDHIDTAEFYGPHTVNALIVEALHPYPAGLTLVTKVGASRGDDGSWHPAQSPAELVAQVHDNLRSLRVEVLDVVNYRCWTGMGGPREESIAERFAALAELRRQGLIRHLGISTATARQLAEAQAIAPVVCVQNLYNLAHREDEALVDDLARQNVAYVPYFPLGGFSPLQSDILTAVAARLGLTPMQVALRWLLDRSPNILLIPGTSSVAHLRENLAAAKGELPAADRAALDGIASAAAPAANG